jgi:hypothetical protein
METITHQILGSAGNWTELHVEVLRSDKGGENCFP